MIPFHHFRLVTLLTLASPPAQDATFHPAANMRADSKLVLINALVTDRHGRVITRYYASKFIATNRYCPASWEITC
jgi:hypothetical protein